MPFSALTLALGSAVLHAAWNLLLGRARDVQAAAAATFVLSVAIAWKSGVNSPVWNATAVLSSDAPASETAAIASRIVSPESHVSSTISTR